MDEGPHETIDLKPEPQTPLVAGAAASCSSVADNATTTGMAELLLLGMDDTVASSAHGNHRPRFEPESWIGRLVGDYRIEQELGRGGMGAVFRATNVRVGSTVALKLLRFAPGETVERLRRFEFEARAAALLNHPNIVNVFDVGQVGDLYYLAMEYFRGRSLAEVIDEKPMTPERAVRIMLDVCEALEFAHAQGFVHRDIKPSNILIEQSGRAQLMDFGLARSIHDVKQFTETGAVMGTLHYMSPEQARGQSHEADRRSDVYSLGVVLYEMLTGTVPFKGKHALELLHRICNEEPVRMRKRKPDLDRDLEVIGLKAIEKIPSQRYQTVAALADDLKRYAANDTIMATPPTAIYRAQKFLMRHSFACWSVCSTLIAVLLVAFGFILHDFRLVRQFETEAQRRAQAAAEEAERKLPQHVFEQEASVLLDPGHEAWRWFHSLRLAGKKEEARKALLSPVLLSHAEGAGDGVEANRQLWLGILETEFGGNGDAHFYAAKSIAGEANRRELVLAAQAYLTGNVEVPAGLSPEARAVLAYHRGHAALLRGRSDEARTCWTRAVELSMSPIECKCAKVELDQLNR